MNDFLTIKHSYNAGDAITILPGLQHIYETTGKKTVFMQVLNLPAFYYEGAVHPIQLDGKNVCMNEVQWGMLKPLLEAQEYIERCEVWEGQEFHIDFDVTRDRKTIPMPVGNIHFWPFFIVPELACDLSETWIFTSPDHPMRYEFADKIIINRTERYTNPYLTYYFLKEYESMCVFAGTIKEHDIFCKSFKLDIPLLGCNNFLDLATFIKNSKLFIGNQSFCWHLADATKATRILEYCPQFPNTHPTGRDGYAVIYQQSLELYVRKLINQ